MAIKEFKRIKNYFSAFQKIKANNIDSQFNLLTSYLNQEIWPVLQKLSYDRIPGSSNPSDAGKFLQNIGDGNTRWGKISNESFAKYSLSLSKLAKVNAGSVLAYDVNQVIKAITPSASNEVLTGRLNKDPIWQKLTDSNLADRTITGDNVADGSITYKNLPSYLRETLIGNKTITGDKFKNYSITANKIADKTLKLEKLEPILAMKFPDMVWSHIIPNGYLSKVNSILDPMSPHTRNEIIDLFNDQNKPPLQTKHGKAINVCFPVSKFGRSVRNKHDGKIGFVTSNVHGLVESRYKLKDNSIDALRVALMPKYIQSDFTGNKYIFDLRKKVSSLLADDSVELEHLDPLLRKKLLEAK